jgi:hypothetical protein
MDARAYASPKGLRPRRRVKPAHDDRVVLVTAPALQRTATQVLRAALRPGHGDQLAKPPRRSYKRRLIVRTGEICMTIVYSQIAPSRPMRMLDACVAL